jgi:PIN domain nuclease of toxin-antitoxin system
VTRAILLDTPIVIWMRLAPDRLTEREKRAIDAAPCRYFSAVSLWEMAILASLGRIERDPRLFELPRGIDLLPVSPAHCHEVLELPQLHKDPFDRMLIAQARIDQLLLLTRDAQITAYGRSGAITANLSQ